VARSPGPSARNGGTGGAPGGDGSSPIVLQTGARQ
jgi:hypothetical protein